MTARLWYDGATGQETWRYSSPNWLDSTWAVRSDGTIFAVENTNDFSITRSPNFAVALVGIDGATGVERLRVPIPPSRVGLSSVLSDLLGWPHFVSFEALSTAVVFSTIVGVFFGYYPAGKAAKLNPIEALRYE
jgi:hypothetical protein